MDEFWDRFDKMGNSFFLKLENISRNEILAIMGGITVLYTYGKMKSGVMHSPLYTLFGIHKPRTEVMGYVKEGYEPAREAFQQLLDEGMEENMQACAYVNGELVLDLVGVLDKDHKLSQTYNASSLQNVFSSSKAVASVVVAMLVDRGHLQYDMKVAEIWPEFGQHGKDVITIEELVKHEAGLEKFMFSLTADELHRERLKDSRSEVGSKIASATSNRSKLPRTARGKDVPRAYHAVTRGFIINEVVMRADPSGRTMGEFIREEIAIPLDIVGQLTMGCDTAEHASKIYPLTGTSKLWVILQFLNRLNPRLNIGYCILQLFLMNMGIGYKLASLVMGEKYAVPSLVAGKGETPFLEVVDTFNHPSIRNCEAPSANMHATARGLARLAAVMAGGGAAHGVRLLSAATVEQSHWVTEDDVKYDSVLQARTKFNKGGWNVFDSHKFAHYRHGMVGWFGIGGSVLQWQRELNIGFGWTNSLMVADVSGANAASVQNAVTLCAQNVASTSSR
mmetsp:Transcript_13707/g.22668  ORF Transcript_13707/g.22668 Transcript_13707/m.22668 type:complete len:507 (-) Transcript_13707:301-1821(-)